MVLVGYTQEHFGFSLTSDLLGAAMILTALLVQVLLNYFEAPYGRYTQPGRIWGFGVPARLAWLLQEAPALFIPLIVVSTVEFSSVLDKWPLILFIFHYIHRALIYPLHLRSNNQTPFWIMMMAMSFCLYNGYMQCASAFEHPLSQDKRQYGTACIVIGTITFFVGMAINIHADYHLINLRFYSSADYGIPKGGMFEYVSGANYFGEIVEWMGYAICAGTLPAAAFAIFVAANLAPRAVQHHDYYRRKFSTYPRHRKALIPALL
eukprot:Clim_evm61s191 gene=Clim_evmTU61s191